MSSSRLRRIQKEIEETRSDVESKIEITTAGAANDLTHLEGKFLGPPDTPYAGGAFFIDIRIPNDYPFKPPIMKFKTKIWHPNVSSQTGAICLDTLSQNWSPVLTLKGALISIQGLLASPEPKDPQDAEVASMLLKDPKLFAYTAHSWAVKYSGAPQQDAHGNGNEGGQGGMQGEVSQQGDTKQIAEPDLSVYHGYNKHLVDRFCEMGFPVDRMVAAFEHFEIDKNEGEDYELEEEYMGDITAWLFHEP